jgi:2'-5' RNA ligase
VRARALRYRSAVAPNWFIALPVSSGPWQERLVAPAGVRLFGPNDLHLTVAFLGAVPRARAEAAFALARSFQLQALEVTLGEVEALGGRRRPSAFSALLARGRAEVERAIGEARAAMWSAAGARTDDRPPLAHVTLARPQRRASNAGVQAARRWAKALRLGEPVCRLDRIALYTWNEDRTQALFQITEALPLTEAERPANQHH